MDSPKQITAAFATLILFIVMLYLSCCVESVPQAAIPPTVIGCNGATYGAGDPFILSLGSVLPDLQTKTPNQQSYDYRNFSPYSTDLAYGHATCSTSLSSVDCANCLVYALTAMLTSCSRNIGANFVSSQCSIRYERTAFTN